MNSVPPDDPQAAIDEIMRNLSLKVTDGIACAVGLGAYGMLAAMEIDFAALPEEAQNKRIAEIYGTMCVAIAALPVVQTALQAMHPGITPQQCIAAVVAALGLLFKPDSRLIEHTGLEPELGASSSVQ